MLPGQWEARVAMVEGCPTPALRVMAGSTILTELAVMGVIGCMAGVTICRCSFESAVLVASQAGHILMLSCKHKPGVVMIEGYVFPATWNMTLTTVLSKLTTVRIVCRMAGITTFRCASILAVCMAGLASDRRMLTQKRESGLAVIEIHISPPSGVMAFSTIFSKLSVMLVILLMTPKTICRCATISTRMAAFAIDINMFPGQLERGKVVIEDPVIPGTWVMAGRAFFPKTSIMKIIFLVAGKTCRWCSNEKKILMTFFTSNIDMRPYQLEACQVMIILGRLPPFRGMAIATLISQIPCMGIIHLVTGITSLWSELQIGYIGRALVTLRT